jgi:hypothetical protein
MLGLMQVEVVDALLRVRGVGENEVESTESKACEAESTVNNAACEGEEGRGGEAGVLNSNRQPVLWFGGHDQNQPSESASPGSALMVQRVERWRARLESEIVGRAARERVFTTWAEGNEATEANEANVNAGVTQADNVGEGRSGGKSGGSEATWQK